MIPTEPDNATSLALPARGEIVVALDYLDQSFATGREFAVLISDDPVSAAETVRRFTMAHEHELRCVQVASPTPSAHTFLQTLLIELGLEPVESTVDDLQRLLLVVFKQAQTDSKRCVVLLEQAHELGPRVFEALRDIARDLTALNPPPLFILTGTSTLARVLDSRGMMGIADLTRLRFDHRHPARPAETDSHAPLTAVQSTASAVVMGHASLAIMFGDRLIDRIDVGATRVLIGRSVHNDIILPGRYVSRHHAMIFEGPEGLTLMDLKSTNGTLVNSRSIQTRILQDGDWLGIGDYRLRFSDNRPAASRSVQGVADSPDLAETLVMRSMQGIAPDRADETDSDSQKSRA